MNYSGEIFASVVRLRYYFCPVILQAGHWVFNSTARLSSAKSYAIAGVFGLLAMIKCSICSNQCDN